MPVGTDTTPSVDFFSLTVRRLMREGMTFEQAVDRIMKDAQDAFDEAMDAALKEQLPLQPAQDTHGLSDEMRKV